MELIDIFVEKSKDKFLNQIVKIPKQFDWYLGLVIKVEDFDEVREETVEDFIVSRCNIIYDKSEKHIQLLKHTLIDDNTLLIFGADPTPYSNIIGIVNAICRYLECKVKEVNYAKYFRDMIMDTWGEQQYFYLISDNKAYDLRTIKED